MHGVNRLLLATNIWTKKVDRTWHHTVYLTWKYQADGSNTKNFEFWQERHAALPVSEKNKAKGCWYAKEKFEFPRLFVINGTKKFLRSTAVYEYWEAVNNKSRSRKELVPEMISTLETKISSPIILHRRSLIFNLTKTTHSWDSVARISTGISSAATLHSMAAPGPRSHLLPRRGSPQNLSTANGKGTTCNLKFSS